MPTSCMNGKLGQGSMQSVWVFRHGELAGFVTHSEKCWLLIRKQRVEYITHLWSLP